MSERRPEWITHVPRPPSPKEQQAAAEARQEVYDFQHPHQNVSHERAATRERGTKPAKIAHPAIKIVGGIAAGIAVVLVGGALAKEYPEEPKYVDHSIGTPKNNPYPDTGPYGRNNAPPSNAPKRPEGFLGSMAVGDTQTLLVCRGWTFRNKTNKTEVVNPAVTPVKSGSSTDYFPVHVSKLGADGVRIEAPQKPLDLSPTEPGSGYEWTDARGVTTSSGPSGDCPATNVTVHLHPIKKGESNNMYPFLIEDGSSLSPKAVIGLGQTREGVVNITRPY